MNKQKQKVIVKNLNQNQIKDSGMALVFILLILSLIYKNEMLVKCGIVLLFLDMLVSKIFYPFAILWYALSNLIGLLIPKIILTIIFFVVVTPIGMFRRVVGIDSLQLKKFKKDTNSVMVVRNYKFLRSDIAKPY